MRIVPCASRHIGSRKEQQDDFGFSDINNLFFVRHGGVLAVLTDGMGGMAKGKEASQVGKLAMLQAFQDKAVDESISMALYRSLLSANAAVVSLAKESRLINQVGSTLAAAVIHHDRLYYIAAGDSRIYLYRKRVLSKLTMDHIYGRVLDSLAARGEISIDEAVNHPYRDALTSGLGWEKLEAVEQSQAPLPLEEGDRILLCSDGIYKTLTESEMTKMLSDHPQKAADSLIETAISKNLLNQDNMTAIILACELDKSAEKSKFSSSIKPNRRKKPLLFSLLTGFLILMGLLAYITFREISMYSR
jgi:PPM family protein phosphatase